jgi:uncharacterized protein (UPF0332 family)
MSELHVYLAKAEESLLGAISELEQGRYNNSANRAYYACFQAAIIDRLLEIQIDEGLPVYVVPLRPLTRIPVQ